MNSFLIAQECRNICDAPDEYPSFKKGKLELIEYVKVNLAPIIKYYHKNDSIFKKYQSFAIVVDENGTACDLDFFEMEYSEGCQASIRKLFLGKNAWIAGSKNDETVIARYRLTFKIEYN